MSPLEADAEADLVRLVDRLEDAAESFVTLPDVLAAASPARAEVVAGAVARGLLLVDQRTRVDGTSVTLCRLNRHHPLVQRLTGW